MNVSRAALALAISLSFARADSLEEVLKRMDDDAPQFMSMTAKIKRQDYQKTFDELDEMNGTVRMQRTKNGPAAVFDFTGKDPKTLFLSGHTAAEYLPNAKLERVYDAGKYVSVMQETLLLGFGARVADLKKTYNFVLGGVEQVAGKRTTRIQLTPTNKNLKDLFTKIDLWIPDGESNPSQEKIWTGTKGDYILAIYSDIEINPKLPDSAFQFKPPPGTERRKAN